MNKLLTSLARQAFESGDFQTALDFYEKLESLLKGCFKQNIDVCKAKLSEADDTNIVKSTARSKSDSGRLIKVATILDEFSWECWKYEANFFQVTPNSWESEIDTEMPDILFVESAWAGNFGKWQYKISNSKKTPSNELVNLIMYCKKKAIPTIFWNKEDPVHWEHFINTATLFDVVCTTDANCVKKYVKRLGHDRVFPLMFAAQPVIHNPSKVPGQKTAPVAFAGAWYNGQHDQRAKDMRVILDGAKNFGLHIYDRNFGKKEIEAKHGWPADFQEFIVGGVSYKDIVHIYKKYKIFLNVNSIVDSDTMFSRRVFELLACGTPVISTHALGIEKTFGRNLVFMSNSSEEIYEYLKKMLNDQHALQKISDLGIKEVMSAHTYGHRLNEIIIQTNKFLNINIPCNFGKIKDTGFNEIPTNAPLVTVRDFRVKEQNEIKISPRRNMLVGVIIDEIFEPYFSHEFNLVKFKPYEWTNLFNNDNLPKLIFIDSAWNGNDGSWAGLINRHGTSEPSQEFVDLISWCKNNGIMTIFWSREDPPNYEIFAPTAKLCDFIYTTDLDCVARYKEMTGHERVGVSPFAVQPKIHNPINSKEKKEGEVLFAGTWYDVKHDKRKDQMEMILAPLLDRGLHIFDRMLYFTRTEAYKYPEKYRRNIAGTLDYREVMEVTKRYKVMLNVNSVIESPTMCSCRITESLMSGTAVISGYAAGADNLIGNDIVLMPKSEDETRQIADTLLGDDLQREKLVLRAQRKILKYHLVEHRVNSMLQDVGLNEYVTTNTNNKISVIVSTNRPRNIYRILENYNSQSWPAKELIIGIHGHYSYSPLIENAIASFGMADIRVFYYPKETHLGGILNNLIDVSTGSYISKMDDDDIYFPNYLLDLMNCFKYTDADIVGKHSYFVYVEQMNKIYMRLAGRECKYLSFVAGGTLLVNKAVFDQVRFPELSVGEDTGFLKLANKAGFKIYSSDKFNFLCIRRLDVNDHAWKINFAEYVKKLEYIADGCDYSFVEC